VIQITIGARRRWHRRSIGTRPPVLRTWPMRDFDLRRNAFCGKGIESRSGRKRLIYSTCATSWRSLSTALNEDARLELALTRHRRALVKGQEMPTPQGFPSRRILPAARFVMARLAESA